jgi:NAD(P)-dependent dehydrogenase (short-subunit alcohol dehydrogenase family)
LVINHGTLSPVKRIADSDPSEWRSTYDVNFFSAVAFVRFPSFIPSFNLLLLNHYNRVQIKPAIPHLRETNGKIILTSSGAATGGKIFSLCFPALN